MNNINILPHKGAKDPNTDFGTESFWADFRVEVGIAPKYGFPDDLETAALVGELEAQNNLGVLYYTGKNMEQDYEQAAYWFAKAAEEGFAVSQYNLGLLNMQGKGLERDDTLSFQWFLKAAEQGYGIAQYRLSQCYANGKGTEFSIKNEYKWLKKAADSGNPLAQYNLGKFSTEEILLKEIFGDSDDPNSQVQKKIKWLVTAAAQGYAPAQIKLGNYYQHGCGLKKDYKKAVSWYLKAAEQEYSRGQYYMGSCYYNGIGLKQNFKKAVDWFILAAEKGDSDAQFNLGLCYHNSEDAENNAINLDEAVKWYLKAAEQGNVDALYQLIRLSKQNFEACHYLKEAVSCFRKAAEQGNADAQYQIGLIYERGFGVDHTADKQEAVAWFRKAAEQGNAEAQYHLGQSFEQGTEDGEAAKWYYEAAENGHEKACFSLGKAFLHGSCNNIKVTPDHNKAIKYLSRASKQRKSYILGELAVCYLCGFGVKRNLAFAIDIFQSLALRDYEIPPISLAAKMALAKMYLAGEGVKTNEENTLYYLYSIKDFLPYFTASKVYKFEECLKLKDKDLFQWLNRKASEKDIRSQAILGLYHLCRENFEQAKKWYQLAADQGDLRAKAALSGKHKDKLQQ
jgi:TPR repeat protein